MPSPSRTHQEVLAFGCRRAPPQGTNKSVLGSGHAAGLQDEPLQRLGPVRVLALLQGSTQRLAFRVGDRNRVFVFARSTARGALGRVQSSVAFYTARWRCAQSRRQGAEAASGAKCTIFLRAFTHHHSSAAWCPATQTSTTPPASRIVHFAPVRGAGGCEGDASAGARKTPRTTTS